jgi:putative SOS response-associated peptidase YedK
MSCRRQLLVRLLRIAAIPHLSQLMVPYTGDELQALPVGTHVNRPANDDPACLEPLSGNPASRE